MIDNEIYRKRGCQLCGAFVFEKHLGTNQVLDGGFTRVEKFEKSGYGSLVVVGYDLPFSRIELKLCPECAEKLDKIIVDAIKSMRKGSDAVS